MFTKQLLKLDGLFLFAALEGEFNDAHYLSSLFRFYRKFGIAVDGIAQVDKVLPVIAQFALYLALELHSLVLRVERAPDIFRLTSPVRTHRFCAAIEGGFLHVQSVLHEGTVRAVQHVGGPRYAADHARFQGGGEGGVVQAHVEVVVRFGPWALFVNLGSDSRRQAEEP